jgi:hypothetical protein
MEMGDVFRFSQNISTMAFVLLHHRYLLKKLLTSTVKKKLVMTLITQAESSTLQTPFRLGPQNIRRRSSQAGYLLLPSSLPGKLQGHPKQKEK